MFCFLKFAAGGIGKTDHMPRIFNDGHLHSHTNAEERDIMLPRIPYGLDLTFNATVAETARNNNTVYAVQHLIGILRR